MHLHEEYVKRHKLSIPLIRYDGNSVALLKSKNSPVSWKIIDISWSSCHWHPGKFTIKIMAPRHDSGRLQQVFPTREVYWDQYEDHVIGLRSMNESFYAISKEDSLLATWYVFLWMYDTYLSDLSDDFKNSVSESIDPDRTDAERKYAFEKARLQMSVESSVIEDAFESQMSVYHNYADWLVDLING